MGDTEDRLSHAERQLCDQAATIHRLHNELLHTQACRRIACEALERVVRADSLDGRQIAIRAIVLIEKAAA